jgi:ankyrin repeat protein
MPLFTRPFSFRTHNILDATNVMRHVQGQMQSEMKDGMTKILDRLHQLHLRIRDQQSLSRSTIVEGWLSNLDSCAQSVYESSVSMSSTQTTTIQRESQLLLPLSRSRTPLFPASFFSTCLDNNPRLSPPPSRSLSTLIQGRPDCDTMEESKNQVHSRLDRTSDQDMTVESSEYYDEEKEFSKWQQAGLEKLRIYKINDRFEVMSDTGLSDSSQSSIAPAPCIFNTDCKVCLDPDEELLNIMPSTSPDRIRDLVEQGASPNNHHYRLLEFIPWGGTYYISSPLYEAVESSNIKCAKTLIDLGAKVNGPECKYYVKSGYQYLDTPMAIAVRREDLSMITLLLDAGADVNFINSTIYNGSIERDGFISQADAPAIFKAVRALVRGAKDSSRDLAIIDKLLEAGADVNILQKWTTNGKVTFSSILQHLCIRDTLCDSRYRENQNEMQAQLATRMLQHGALLDRPTLSSDESPLQLAIQISSLKLADVLLDHGADINEVFQDSFEISRKRLFEVCLCAQFPHVTWDEVYPTPLSEAAGGMDIDAISLLCSRGADTNLESPLHWLIWSACHNNWEYLSMPETFKYHCRLFKGIQLLRRHGASVGTRMLFCYLADISETEHLDWTGFRRTSTVGVRMEELSVLELAQRMYLLYCIDRSDLLSVLRQQDV